MDFDREIKKIINQRFPQLEVSIFPDETQDNMIVAINDDLYHSEDYLSLVMDIKMQLLWKNNIFNYLFVKEEVVDSVNRVLQDCQNIETSSFYKNYQRFSREYDLLIQEGVVMRRESQLKPLDQGEPVPFFYNTAAP